MNISIAGAGRVATALAGALKNAGHTIVQITNRDAAKGQALAKNVNAAFCTKVNELLPVDVLIIAVKDDAIRDVAASVSLPDTIVAHTSGTQSITEISHYHTPAGVFYPLQTFTGFTPVDITQVPLLLEANDEKTLQALMALAKSITPKAHVMDEQQRQWIHVAAVFANNFTNHMYSVSEQLLALHNLPFEVLKPLIQQTASNALQQSPESLQTGPAVRNDMLTIDKHLHLLADHQRLQKIYEVLTESILAQQRTNL